MIRLNNGILTAEIAEKGAELKSLTKNGREFIWDANPAIWGFSAPLLFPICGALKDGRFIHECKEYFLSKHGFARVMDFEAEKLSENSAVFKLCSSPATQESYPFDFELRVIFTLAGEKLAVRYEVENTGNDTMYFSIGAHEGYKTEEGVDQYDIVFDEPTTLFNTIADRGLITEKRVPILENGNVLPLSESMFSLDALIFRDVTCRAATLRHRITGKGVRVEFPDMKHLLLWQMYGAPYLCIEPWTGLPDTEDASGKIEEKIDVISLSRKSTYTNEHFIIPII